MSVILHPLGTNGQLLKLAWLHAGNPFRGSRLPRFDRSSRTLGFARVVLGRIMLRVVEGQGGREKRAREQRHVANERRGQSGSMASGGRRPWSAVAVGLCLSVTV